MIEAVVMTQVVAFSFLILPYQAIPLAIGFNLGGVPNAARFKTTFAQAALTLPLDLLWWQALGYLD